jgi:DNA-binding response OmpR family regulator
MSRGTLRTGADENRFILRAELHHGDQPIDVTYAFDIKATSVFVASDAIVDVGSELSLRLSFPKLLEPLDLVARVESHMPPSGPGAPAGMRLEVEPDPRLTALVERACDTRLPAQACRVLLVEDNGFIRDIFEYGMRVFFEARGAYSLDHAETVEAAWQQLTGASYDVAIVDYYLPADSGALLIERVRADARMADLPIVAVSVGGREARDASLAAGADLFLDKPLVFRDLFNTLRVLALSGEAATTSKKTILVFDDSTMILELTRAALEAAGFEVAIAEDLATFEQYRGELDPDLILVDVQMPEAFGDDVVLALREGHGVRVPILLVSSLEESELASRSERARAAGYIQKKVGISELVRRCKEVLEATL